MNTADIAVDFNIDDLTFKFRVSLYYSINDDFVATNRDVMVLKGFAIDLN